MGCRHSCEASEPFNRVRVISISGHMEAFDPPITAGDVTGKDSPYVLCSAGQLLASGSRKLRPEDQLESGRLYFLLPPSVLESAPLDLAALATRLTILARSAGKAKSESFSAAMDPAAEVKLKEVKAKQRPEPHTWRPALSTVREASFSPSINSQSMQSKGNA